MLPPKATDPPIAGVTQYTGTFQGLREGLALRGEATDNATMTIESRLCVGCKLPFIPKRENERYHSQSCRMAKKRDPERDRAGRTDPPPDMMRLWAQRVLACRARGAVGYRLYCPVLNCVLPLPNTQRRNGTRPAHGNFSLDPLEYPLIPLETDYLLVWIFPGDTAEVASPPQVIRPNWVDHGMDQLKGFKHLLQLYRQQGTKSERKKKIEATQEANLRLTEFFRPSPIELPPPPPPRSLPSQEETLALAAHTDGNSDGDESGAE